MRVIDREILRLAVPALGALIAEPLFLLTDTALVGHLGADALAALGIASTILQTAVGLLLFLAYATTPAVARALGAGDRPGAIRSGIDGLWLALGIGVIIAVAGIPASRPLVALFGSTPAVTEAATTFLLVSLAGIPAMLIVIAAMGLLRGLQDTRTPLVVAVAGFAANAGLNALFIYGFGWGVAGSAAGTVVAQWGMAAVYIVIAVRAARGAGVPMRPRLHGVRLVAASGFWLLLRTASLRVAILANVVVASGMGVTELATLQVAMTVFNTIAFALDALAIAGQAMVGHGLGAGDAARVKAITQRLITLGIWGGVITGALIAATSWLIGPVFTSDPVVLAHLVLVLIVMALGIPIAGYVFVLDGVLMGAGDHRYLAFAGLLNLLIYAPLLATVVLTGAGIGWLWAAFGLGYIGARALTLGLRARGDRWIVLGATSRVPADAPA